MNSQAATQTEEMLFDSDSIPLVNNSGESDLSEHAGAITLFTVGLVCTVGNLISMTTIIFNARYRKTSLAILCHHCFLDLLKSLYCFPYGYSLLKSIEIPYCGVVGSSYVFIMTTSSYNLLALVVNEEYELVRGEQEERHSDRHCIFFGIFIIWFMSLLLNLGVAIIPSNTTFIEEIGNCIFLYGVPNGFVLHVLWITLVTMAIILALTSFFTMYRRVSLLAKQAKWNYIHRSLSGEFESGLSSEASYSECHRLQNVNYRKSHLQFHLRRVLIFISMITSFALFWYPLFFLTIFDPGFHEPNAMYKILTIAAWSQPITTPLFCSVILRDIRLRDSIVKDLSANMIPLRLKERLRNGPTSLEEETQTFDLGISNSDFEQIGTMNTESKFTQVTLECNHEDISVEESVSPRRTDVSHRYRTSQV